MASKTQTPPSGPSASVATAPVQSSGRRGHLPVMPREVLEALALAPGSTIVDCTAGGGGHLALFCEATGPGGRVIALDRDARAFEADAAGGVVQRYSDRCTLWRSPFSHVVQALAEHGVGPVDALFADLGVSSFQLDEGARGFSFQKDAPLDMRMDTSQGETAQELIARLSEDDLADVLFVHGGERKSRRVARAIKALPAPPATTTELANVVRRAVRGGGAYQRIDPATRSFQALRIAVNREMDELDTLLAAVPQVVRTGGRVALLSFHSGEDRRIKVRFRAGGLRALHKRPVLPTEEECDVNPRARSAKLRVAVVDPAAAAGRVNKWPRAEDVDGDESDDDDRFDEGEA